MRTIDSEEGDMPWIFAKVLAALQSSRDHRVRTIAAATGYSPSYTQRILRRMEAAGLVKFNNDPRCRNDISVNPRPKRSRK